MQDLRNQPFTVFDISKAIWTYRRRVIITTILVTVLTTLFVVLLPKRFESEAKLFVRLGGNSTSFDPVTIGNSISLQESRETEMNSIVDMLTSRGLADKVVAEIGEQRILQKYSWLDRQLENLSQLASFGAKESADVSSGDITKAKETAASEILKSLKVTSPKRSTSIGVVYVARDPVLAYEIVQSVIKNYQTMHVTATKSGGSVDFFQVQFSAQDKTLTDCEKRFRDVKNAADMLTLQGKQGSLQAEFDSIKQLQIQTKADYAAAISRVADLEKSMSTLPESLASATTTGIELAASDSMRDRLYALEIQEKSLQARLYDDHPELKKVRQQLAEAQKIMADQPTDRTHNVVGSNPVRLELQKDHLIAKATVASLGDKLKELAELDKALAVRIAALNSLEIEAEDLQRKINIAKENHATYARKLEESRIKSAMDSESLSNVSVVSAPSVRWKHSSPNRPLLAVVGAFVALFFGVFNAVVSELKCRWYPSSTVAEIKSNRRENGGNSSRPDSDFQAETESNYDVERSASPR